VPVSPVVVVIARPVAVVVIIGPVTLVVRTTMVMVVFRSKVVFHLAFIFGAKRWRGYSLLRGRGWRRLHLR